MRPIRVFNPQIHEPALDCHIASDGGLSLDVTHNFRIFASKKKVALEIYLVKNIGTSLHQTAREGYANNVKTARGGQSTVNLGARAKHTLCLYDSHTPRLQAESESCCAILMFLTVCTLAALQEVRLRKVHIVGNFLGVFDFLKSTCFLRISIWAL